MKAFISILILLLTTGSSSSLNAEERRVIENHGFGVFTTDDSGVIMVLQNENCVGYYRVASGKTAVGEGTVDFRILPVTNIPFGENDLRISCIADHRLSVVAVR